MNAPKSMGKSLPDMEAEISNVAEEDAPKLAPQNGAPDIQRIRSAVAELSSNSIDVLKALTSELQEVQRFLDSEVQRVQGEIDNALAGIKIIIDTITPWKSSPISLATPIPRAGSRMS
jgi:hypothetical protein